jgi:hypothetical protein
VRAGSHGRRPLLRAEDGCRAGGSPGPRDDPDSTASDCRPAGDPRSGRGPPRSRAGISSTDSHGAAGAHRDPGSSPERDPASRGRFDPNRSAGAPGRGGSCDSGSGNTDRAPNRRTADRAPNHRDADGAPDSRAAVGDGATGIVNAHCSTASRHADAPPAADRDGESLSPA